PALEDQHHLLAGLLDPALHLEQLDLERPLALLVFMPGHLVVVGIPLAPGLGVVAVGVRDQLGQRILGLLDLPVTGTSGGTGRAGRVRSRSRLNSVAVGTRHIAIITQPRRGPPPGREPRWCSKSAW